MLFGLDSRFFSFFDVAEEEGTLASSCHLNRSTFPMLLGLTRFSLFARRNWTSGSRSLFWNAANILVSSFFGTGFSS